jgi:hypothetical protein
VRKKEKRGFIKTNPKSITGDIENLIGEQAKIKETLVTHS